MSVRTGLFRIVKEAQSQYRIQVGQPEFAPGDSPMRYMLTFLAEDFSNINMDPGTGAWADTWPPIPVEGGFVIEGTVGRFPNDSFTVINPKFVTLQLTEESESPAFDVTYLDNTVETPTEKVLKQNVVEYTWRPGLGALGGLGFIAAILAGVLILFRKK